MECTDNKEMYTTEGITKFRANYDKVHVPQLTQVNAAVRVACIKLIFASSAADREGNHKSNNNFAT